MQEDKPFFLDSVPFLLVFFFNLTKNLSEELANISVKGKIVNILGFMGQSLSCSLICSLQDKPTARQPNALKM